MTEEFIVTAVCSGCGKRVPLRADLGIRKHRHSLKNGLREIKPGTIQALTTQDWRDFQGAQRRVVRKRMVQGRRHRREANRNANMTLSR
jgi:hypothetical protein